MKGATVSPEVEGGEIQRQASKGFSKRKTGKDAMAQVVSESAGRWRCRPSNAGSCLPWRFLA